VLKRSIFVILKEII